jgi:hypothetical protein
VQGALPQHLRTHPGDARTRHGTGLLIGEGHWYNSKDNRVWKVPLHRVQGTFGRTDSRFEGAVLFHLRDPPNAPVHGELDYPVTLYPAIVVTELGYEAC